MRSSAITPLDISVSSQPILLVEPLLHDAPALRRIFPASCRLARPGIAVVVVVCSPSLAKGTAFSHRLCVTCFDAGQRGTLQFDARTIMSQDIYRCGRCKTETKLGTPITPSWASNNNNYGDPWAS